MNYTELFQRLKGVFTFIGGRPTKFQTDPPFFIILDPPLLTGTVYKSAPVVPLQAKRQ